MFSLAAARALFPLRTLVSGQNGVNRESVIMPGVKHLSFVLKMTAIELTKAYLLVKKILIQLGISQSTFTQMWTLKMANSLYLMVLVEPVPRRLQGVLESGGNITKY